MVDSVESATASMFGNAQNIYIANGSFLITTNHIAQEQRTQSLNMLHQRAAPNAILNAGGRADEVRCHPGTREEVISRIEKWKDARDSRTEPIFWLSGPAGAGKTAIMQTIAERCKEQDRPEANFFFFRTDHSRNGLSPLVATLVHQVMLLYPPTRDLVATVLSINPLILNSVLDEQLSQLIVAPLQAVQRSSLSYIPPLIVIDGLDECMSEEKRSQQQILRAFDKVLMTGSCPFRLLVASRDELQIQAVFNNISSQLLPLYLNDQYFPERDIRIFVKDKFKEILQMHPLSHTLDKTWPSDQVVEDIVTKSSGQFVYAATVMRFIMDSLAIPSLSLARVLGAAPVSNKSPFAYLDAIYTYILSQVEDQETLQGILRCQLLQQAVSNDSSKGHFEMTLLDILSIYNPKIAKAMVHSCLANLTPLIKYTEDFNITFHHASFPDYLLDQSRSSNYFTDLDALNFNIQPAVWRTLRRIRLDSRFKRRHGLEGLAYWGIIRLRQLPSGILNILTTLEPLFPPGTLDPGVQAEILQQLSDLCSCSDDETNYKRILQSWTTLQDSEEEDSLFDDLLFQKWSSRDRMYIAMACVERDQVVLAPRNWIKGALCPTTESTIPEVALWFRNLLRRIKTENYPSAIQTYHHLLREWTFWAAQSNIPLDDVDNLPNVRWYSAMADIERNVSLDITLYREKHCDIPETATWVAILLHRIYKEMYPSRIQEYNRIVQKWTSWAANSNIPLDRAYWVDTLPNAQWYYTMAIIEHDITVDIPLYQEEDCDVSETATWITTLLHRIHDEKYPALIQEYNQLVRKWTSWATENNIPLDGVDDLPNARWYCAMADIERNVMINTPLHREEDCDIPETATWITILLCRIHAEKYPARIQEYNYLLRKWTSWATRNNIPLNGVDDLPNALWYRAMAEIEHNITIDVVLCREEGCDIPETVTWITILLYRIYEEKYCTNIKDYNRLLQKWVLWAALNDIPLNGIADLPNARWYCAMANIECDITVNVTLHPERDCDAPETATWLANLLRRIHKEMHHDNLDEYNRHVQKWTSWATSNNIPLHGVDDLPNVWWYLQQSRIEAWARYFGFGSRSG